MSLARRQREKDEIDLFRLLQQSISSPEESLLEEASEERESEEDGTDLLQPLKLFSHVPPRWYHSPGIWSPQKRLWEGAFGERILEQLLGSELSSDKTIKHGTPADDELQGLGDEIGEKWKMLGRLLGVRDQKLQEINRVHDELCEKGYYMLKHWKRKEGSAATYKAVCDALKHGLLRRPDLAEKFCHIKGRYDPPGIWSPGKRRWEGAFGEGVVWPPPPLLESNPPLRWTRGKRLGAGNFGEVYECRERYRGILAVKIVKMEPQYTEKQKDVKALNNEISILKSLKHERIVSYHGSEQTDGHLHLFMDFMPGGSLSDHIKKYGVLSESKSKRFTQQMLEGICFLHSEDIIHRDIKGSNVLLDGDGNVKLADFGLSKMIQKVGSKTDLVSHCGTPHWMAPEIFWGEGYGRKADIWSLGCTVVEMLTGRPPLGHLEPAAAIFRIGSKPTEPTLPKSVSQDAKEFIKVALTWKPNERPSSVELQCYTFVLNSTEDQQSRFQIKFIAIDSLCKIAS